MADADRCVCCGEFIPEGRQVCPECEGGTKLSPTCDFCNPDSVRLHGDLLSVGYGVYIHIRFCPVCGRTL